MSEKFTPIDRHAKGLYNHHKELVKDEYFKEARVGASMGYHAKAKTDAMFGKYPEDNSNFTRESLEYSQTELEFAKGVTALQAEQSAKWVDKNLPALTEQALIDAQDAGKKIDHPKAIQKV